MKLRTLSLVVAAALLAGPVQADDPPYAGQQGRSTKALSDDDIAALRKGEGMGMAKAAELNGYPGPAHVLQLASQLKLTEAQRRDVQAIFNRMSAAAKPLGGELIAQEQALDRLFAKGDITPHRLAAATATIAELQAAFDWCIWRRISKPVLCWTRIKSLVISSSGVTASRITRCNITVGSANGRKYRCPQQPVMAAPSRPREIAVIADACLADNRRRSWYGCWLSRRVDRAHCLRAG